MATSGVGDGTGTKMADMPQDRQPVKGLKWIHDIRTFGHEVMAEMKKVSWPSRTEVMNTTMVVIVAVFFFAFYLFGTDLLLSYLIEGIEWAAQKVFG